MGGDRQMLDHRHATCAIDFLHALVNHRRRIRVGVRRDQCRGCGATIAQGYIAARREVPGQ